MIEFFFVFQEIAKNDLCNKMTSENLAKVLAPSLMPRVLKVLIRSVLDSWTYFYDLVYKEKMNMGHLSRESGPSGSKSCYLIRF